MAQGDTPIEELVERTGVAAFSSGPDGRISAWNTGSERLLSLIASEAVGEKCHDVLCGLDVFGNDFCSASCPCRQMARSGRCIQPFRLAVQDGSKRRFSVRVTILVVEEGEGRLELVHILEPLVPGESASLEGAGGGTLEELSRIGPRFLTRRELELLRHLDLGLGTEKIAQRLQISVATVRHHIASCLLKLGAHSRLEAVAVARRLNLL